MRGAIVFAFVSLASINLTSLARAQSSRYDDLANSPMIENRPSSETIKALKDELLFQRATQTYLWALPLINTLGMKFGSEKVFGGGYNVLPVWKKRLDAKTLVTTPNSDVIYAMSYFDLAKDGPMVFEAAPGLQGKSKWTRSWQRNWRFIPSRAASVQIKTRSGSWAGSALKRRFSSSRRMIGVAPVKQAIRSSGRSSSSASAKRFSSHRRVSSYSVNRTSRRSFQRPPPVMWSRIHLVSRSTRASGRCAALRAISSISSTSPRSETPAASAPTASAA
jgi:Protein of unknown function (DUF1254)